MISSSILALLLLLSPNAYGVPSPQGVSTQRILLDTGGGGGDGPPDLVRVCTVTAGGNTSCILRWGP